MSDLMLLGVLRMPLDMAMGDELSRFQFHARAQEAAERIDGLMLDAMGCPRERYIRVVHDGSTMVMHPNELADFRVNEGEENMKAYTIKDVWLSEREFDDLPEFDGF